MLISVLLFAHLVTAHADDKLESSAQQSMQFQEAKPTRGPASVMPEPVAYQEVADPDTEAGWCLTCEARGAKYSSNIQQLRNFGQELTKHIERNSSGK